MHKIGAINSDLFVEPLLETWHIVKVVTVSELVPCAVGAAGSALRDHSWGAQGHQGLNSGQPCKLGISKASFLLAVLWLWPPELVSSVIFI